MPVQGKTRIQHVIQAGHTKSVSDYENSASRNCKKFSNRLFHRIWRLKIKRQRSCCCLERLQPIWGSVETSDAAHSPATADVLWASHLIHHQIKHLALNRQEIQDWCLCKLRKDPTNIYSKQSTHLGFNMSPTEVSNHQTKQRPQSNWVSLKQPMQRLQAKSLGWTLKWIFLLMLNMVFNFVADLKKLKVSQLCKPWLQHVSQGERGTAQHHPIKNNKATHNTNNATTANAFSPNERQRMKAGLSINRNSNAPLLIIKKSKWRRSGSSSSLNFSKT